MSDNPDNVIKCLDKGFVRLVDSMGGDDAIVQAARVSYGRGTSKVSQDRGLIRYLMRHRHSTPFEMCEIKLSEMPIFVARNINPSSERFLLVIFQTLLEVFFSTHNPTTLNKQGNDIVKKELKQKVQDYFKEISERSFEIYSELNQAGIARELARSILPVNLYTEWYWKNDLHNLLHFIGLRSDKHAQYEIRVFSNAMAESVKAVAPFAWEAYQDYIVKGMRFSRIEQSLLERTLPDRVIDDINEDIAYQLTATLHSDKPREEIDLYPLYIKEGGVDSREDFKLKWDSGEIKIGNVRELREFKLKLESLKK